MPLMEVGYLGFLFVGGTAFALFLGIASARIERKRERDRDDARGGAPGTNHAASGDASKS